MPRNRWDAPARLFGAGQSRFRGPIRIAITFKTRAREHEPKARSEAILGAGPRVEATGRNSNLACGWGAGRAIRGSSGHFPCPFSQNPRPPGTGGRDRWAAIFRRAIPRGGADLRDRIFSQPPAGLDFRTSGRGTGFRLSTNLHEPDFQTPRPVPLPGVDVRAVLGTLAPPTPTRTKGRTRLTRLDSYWRPQGGGPG